MTDMKTGMTQRAQGNKIVRRVVVEPPAQMMDVHVLLRCKIAVKTREVIPLKDGSSRLLPVGRKFTVPPFANDGKS